MFPWEEMSCWAYPSSFAKDVQDGRDVAAAPLMNEAERLPSLESWVDFNRKPLPAEAGRKQRHSTPQPRHWTTPERDEACRREIDNLFDIANDNNEIDVEIDATDNNAAPVALLDTPLFHRLRFMDRSRVPGKHAHEVDKHKSSEVVKNLYGRGFSADEVELGTERLVCSQIEELLSPISTCDKFFPTAFSQDTWANLNSLSQSLSEGKGKLCDVAVCKNVISEENMELLSEDESYSVFEKCNWL